MTKSFVKLLYKMALHSSDPSCEVIEMFSHVFSPPKPAISSALSRCVLSISYEQLRMLNPLSHLPISWEVLEAKGFSP